MPELGQQQPEWDADLSPLDEDELIEFDDNLPTIDGQPPDRDLDDASQDKIKGLDADLAFRSHRRNSYVDLLHVKLAKDHIQRLPAPGEAIHMVISGRYPLFAVVPAILELASPATIDYLHLVTLSYSRDNAADLLDLLDQRQIGKVWLMVSHYFAHANPHLYDPLAAELQHRGHSIIAMRTHAKMILAKLSNGTTYVIHSSANLRSCKNIEQACMECDPDLYSFHHKWIAGLFSKAVELDKHEDKEIK